MEKEGKEKNLKLLYDYRKCLNKERITLSNSFDRYLLTFSTGSLYLSIVLTNTIGKNFFHMEIMGAGWLSLLLCMIATLLSIKFSEKSFEKQIHITDKIIENVDKNKCSKNIKNCWNTCIDFTNWSSIALFILGVILLSIFYFLNIIN